MKNPAKKSFWEKMKSYSFDQLKWDLEWGLYKHEERRYERWKRKCKRLALKEADPTCEIYYKALLEKNVDKIFPGAKYYDVERYEEYGDMFNGYVQLPWEYSGNKMDVFFYLDGYGPEEYARVKYLMDERCMERALIIAPFFTCEFNCFDGMVFMYTEDLIAGERDPFKKNPTLPLDPNRVW